VRTWLYISHQSTWIDRPQTWQERARALEDQLSDTLHARLLTRFVSSRSGTAGVSGSGRAAPVSSTYHPFAKLAQLSAAWSPDLGPEAELSAQARWVERVVQTRFTDFELSAQAEISLNGQRLARLKPGTSLLSPSLQLLLPEGVDKGARTRIERRLQAHLKDLVSQLLAPIDPPERAALQQDPEAAALRGLLYQLEQGLGSAKRQDVTPQLALLRAVDRSALQRWGVQLGQASVFARGMLEPERLRTRAALCQAWQPAAAKQAQPAEDARSFRLQDGQQRQSCLLRGYVAAGAWAVRCDLAERIISDLHKARTEEPGIVQAHLLCDEGQAIAVLRALPKLRKTRKRRRRKRREQVAGPAPLPT
jgi:ATP-dependent RNA helicase SUPV3L1/SUV3